MNQNKVKNVDGKAKVSGLSVSEELQDILWAHLIASMMQKQKR